jgi:hypothetical protein
LNLLYFFTSWLVLLSAVLQPSAVAAAATDLVLRGDRITLHARDVELRTILREISRQGVVVRVDPSINPRVTVSLDNRDLGQGIDAIVQPHSFALVWRKDDSADGRPTLAELQVFEAGNRAAMEYLDPAPAGAAAGRDQPDYVAGEILLRVEGRDVPAKLHNILRRIHGTVIGHDSRLHIYRIRVARNSDIPALGRQISGTAGVQAEPNYIYTLPRPRQIAPASAPADENPSTAQPGNAPVAVLDSGLLQNVGLEPYIRSSVDALDPARPITDGMGHGTQMAMIASGLVTPDGAITDNSRVPVIAVKIFDEQGQSTSYTLIQGIGYAVDNGARVLSLSWQTDAAGEFLEQALDQAMEHGTVVVAAAGNEATGQPVYPAAFDGVIGVGALDRDGSPWEHSNYGSFVDVQAPGIAELPVGSRGEAGTYAGTSIATAYVAGRAAAYLADHPGATVDEVREFLQTSQK